MQIRLNFKIFVSNFSTKGGPLQREEENKEYEIKMS